MRGCGQRASGGFDLPEQFVDLCLCCSGDAEAELGGAGRAWRQAGVLGEVGPFVQAEQQASVELEEGDGSIGASNLVVELLPDDALRRPAQAVTVEGD